MERTSFQISSESVDRCGGDFRQASFEDGLFLFVALQCNKSRSVNVELDELSKPFVMFVFRLTLKLLVL